MMRCYCCACELGTDQAWCCEHCSGEIIERAGQAQAFGDNSRAVWRHEAVALRRAHRLPAKDFDEHLAGR